MAPSRWQQQIVGATMRTATDQHSLLTGISLNSNHPVRDRLLQDCQSRPVSLLGRAFVRLIVAAMRSLKPIPDISDRLDEGGAIWLGLDLAPKCIDTPIDTSRSYPDAATPDGPKDLIPGESPAGVSGEKRQ